MKVLWFTNTPCSAAEKLNLEINSGGWLKSLEKELIKCTEIELAICFYSNALIDSFIYNEVKYFPIFRKDKKNKFYRLIKRYVPVYYNDNTEIEQLLNVINVFQPNIIHIHGTEENFGLVKSKTNIPVVISIQGLLTPILEKYFSGIPKHIACRSENIKLKLVGSSVNKSYKRFSQYALREQKILQNMDYIIGRTDWDKRITRFLSPSSEYFIGNEILRSSFYNYEWNKTYFNKNIQIITVTSDVLYKGFETVVKAAQLMSENNSLKFTWKIVGIDNKSNIVNIIKKHKNINFNKINIELLGNKNENEIVQLLLNSDIYCQVSHIENSPNSLCEAMMVGMPIIASFVGGTNSLLINDEEGILIQDGDPYSLIGALIELNNDFSKALYLGRNARKKAIKKHNSVDVANNYINIYKAIIKK